ncbi:MAG: hypothetical protein AB7F28_04560 [Candidatus Margulisiibacteriota bacterium]
MRHRHSPNGFFLIGVMVFVAALSIQSMVLVFLAKRGTQIVSLHYWACKVQLLAISGLKVAPDVWESIPTANGMVTKPWLYANDGAGLVLPGFEGRVVLYKQGNVVYAHAQSGVATQVWKGVYGGGQEPVLQTFSRF